MTIGDKTLGYAGSAASDLFQGFGAETSAGLQADSLRLKAKGDLAEAEQYGLASGLASENALYTKTSTAIQQAQQDRATTIQIGGQRNAIAGSGFKESGSGLDILAYSARQGALAKEVIGQQGGITEAGYEEQAKSYSMMAQTATETAVGEEDIARRTDDAGEFAMFGDFAGAALKGAAAVATL